MQRETLKALLEAKQTRRAVVLITPLSGGQEELVADDNLSSEHIYAEHLPAIFRNGSSTVVQGESGEVFLQAFLPAPRLIIIGATHIAQVLVRLARELGVEPFVIDPRTAFATEERFNDVDIITRWPGEALGELKFDTRSALVCLAHVPDIDDEALCAGLASKCFYIGALGSRRSHAKRVERLKAKGFSDQDLSRIHGPVGLDIGAVSPNEIALSIIAELVKTLRLQAGD
jgi:xanthine dehydrogenase accessory factor